MPRSRHPLTTSVAVVVLLSACTAPSGGSTTTMDSAVPTTPPVTADVPTGETATLVRGLDGDSFRVDVDGREDEVRLAGINAPEGDECYGDEARRVLLDLIEGTPLTLVQAGDEERDGFGRRLDLVYVDGTLVNAELVRRGAALAYHGAFDMTAELLADADAAWQARIGMWAPDVCGTAAPPGPTITGVVSDAPGRDEENPNGEWVTISNQGTTPADLSGWGLRDETSGNRFTFPDGVELGVGGAVDVYSGCGIDTGTALYWCNQGPVWTNGGDTALLTDPAGNVVARLAYP